MSRNMIAPAPPVTASECRTTLPSLVMSMPAASASRAASVVAVNEMKWRRLRASFIRVPAPTSGPAWTSMSAVSANGSFSFSYASRGPPTMMARRPDAAPIAPPEIGASSSVTSRAAHRSASSTAVSGAMVEWTVMTVPGRAADSRPSGPATTVRTCASSSTQMPMMSADAARSASDSAAVAPFSTTFATASDDRSNTVSPPAQAARLPAIGPPMLPSPTYPRRMGDDSLMSG